MANKIAKTWSVFREHNGVITKLGKSLEIKDALYRAKRCASAGNHIGILIDDENPDDKITVRWDDYNYDAGQFVLVHNQTVISGTQITKYINSLKNKKKKGTKNGVQGDNNDKRQNITG